MILYTLHMCAVSYDESSCVEPSMFGVRRISHILHICEVSLQYESLGDLSGLNKL